MTTDLRPYSDLFQPRQQGLCVLVACETSGIVRNAFIERGHDAWSCDLLPSKDGSNRHIRGDARDILNDGWDLLMVAHPPCTRLCNSGVRWLSRPPPGRTLDDIWRELREGADLFSAFWNAAIQRICVEDPVMHKHPRRSLRITANSRKASSRGSSAMARRSEPVCGCAISHCFNRPM